MKTAIMIVVLTMPFAVYGQSTFLNLDFEQARVPLTPGPYPPLVSTADALPGWTAYMNNQVQQDVGSNGFSTGGPIISLIDRQMPPDLAEVIDGSYSLLLFAGWAPFIGPVDVGIAQTGIVPPDAASFRFTSPWIPSRLLVTLGGDVVPLQQLDVSDKGLIFGGDISALSGRTVELRITLLADRSFPGNLMYSIDDLEFSPTPVPEPSSVALFLIGSGLLIWHRRTKRRNA